MVIKNAKKDNSEGTVQKKNKTKKATRNPLVAIIGDDGDAQFGLPEKAKGKKKKHSVEGNSSNPKKKKKKKKKQDSELKNGAYVDLPITIQSYSDLESIKEAEKPSKTLKKNRKQGLSCKRGSSPEIPSKGPTTECQEANFLVGKKHKKNVPETCGGDGGCNTKRKKKKKRHKLTFSLVLSHVGDDYSPKGLHPTMKTDSNGRMLSQRKQTLIQDSVSKGESKCICCLTSMDSQGTRNGVLEKGTADPIHEKQEENNCKQNHMDVTHILEKRKQGAKQKQKKKWKSKLKEADFLLTSASNQENHPAVSAETLWKTKPEEKLKKPYMTQNSEGDSKGRKKKKIYTKVANNCSDLLENSQDGLNWEGNRAAIKKTKKKSKKSKKERGPAESFTSGSFWENSDKQCDAPKRKARKRGGSGGAEEEPNPKQAKLKEEAKEKEDEIQVVAIKKGNCDEVKIDKLRRQALQEEIDRESGKMNAIKAEDESDHHFGQWSTAAFDSTEQKTKFLRLLGGFKKGPASVQGPPAKVPKHNMALARQEEEKLQRTLQAEFEKAVDWKQRRGAGLGFQPAPQKRVYIDKYASKSVKFEN